MDSPREIDVRYGLFEFLHLLFHGTNLFVREITRSRLRIKKSKNLRNSSKIIRLAIRSLLQHKLRAALGILGIICGVMAVLAMLAIGEGAKRETLDQIEQLGTKNIYLKAITLTDEQRIKAREKLSQGLSSYDGKRIIKGCSTVQGVAYLKELTVSIIGTAREVSPQVVACSSNYAAVQNLFARQGRFITGHDIAKKNMVCVLGDTVAKSLGQNGKPGGYVRIEDHIFKIIGVLERYNIKAAKASVISVRDYNVMIFVPLGTEGALNHVFSGRGTALMSDLDEIVVQTAKTDQVIRTADVIKRVMEISHGGVEDYQLIIPQALLQQSQKTQRTFNIVLGSIACISLIVGGIGIMNIMLATVSERTKEIGIRRAVGATQQHIIIQFLAESIILTFSGGIIGIIAGLAGVWFISAMVGWKTAITSLSIILPLVMSLLVGIFFGLYPAYQAAKMDPIAALRYE